MFDWNVLTVFATTALERSAWTGFPFGSGGSGGVLVSAARIAFVLVVFLTVAGFLRWLFGPGGRFRPKEFGTEHIALRRERKKAEKDLFQRLKAGEISREEFDKQQLELREQYPE